MSAMMHGIRLWLLAWQHGVETIVKCRFRACGSAVEGVAGKTHHSDPLTTSGAIWPSLLGSC